MEQEQQKGIYWHQRGDHGAGSSDETNHVDVYQSIFGQPEGSQDRILLGVLKAELHGGRRPPDPLPLRLPVSHFFPFFFNFLEILILIITHEHNYKTEDASPLPPTAQNRKTAGT